MKSKIVWALVALNVLLAATLVARWMKPTTAMAQAARPGDYIMVPTEVVGVTPEGVVVAQQELGVALDHRAFARRHGVCHQLDDGIGGHVGFKPAQPAGEEGQRQRVGRGEAQGFRCGLRGFQRRIPAKLAQELARLTSLSQGIWADARANDAPEDFLPTLDQVLVLKQDEAAALADGGDPYDALLDDYEQGMTGAEIAALFDTMRPRLVALNKTYLPDGREMADLVRAQLEERGLRVFDVSALAHEGLEDLKYAMAGLVEEARALRIQGLHDQGRSTADLADQD